MSMAAPQVRQYLLMAAILGTSVVTTSVITKIDVPLGGTILDGMISSTSDAVCWCTGHSHCSSFDRLYPIDYQGTCEFLLAGVINPEDSVVNAFQVYALNDHYFSPGNTAVSYIAQVRLVIGAYEIKLTRNFNSTWIPVTLSVNGVVRAIPYSGTDYNVFYAGLRVRIESSLGVVVEYDGYHTASVAVKFWYMGQLSGLCGNYDYDANNDWTTADGTYVGDKATRANLLGDSYVVKSKTTGCSQPAPPTPDRNNCKRYDEVKSLCTRSVNASVRCVQTLGGEVARAFIATCIVDGCLTNSSLPACAVVSKFFEMCSNFGSTIPCSDWQKAGCGVLLADPKTGRCPAGLRYECDVPACPTPGDNPKPQFPCTVPNREGCVCPDGQRLVRNGTGYKACPVSCLNNGVFRPIGSKWTDPTTCASLSCIANGSSIVSTACVGWCIGGRCVTEHAVCLAGYNFQYYTTFDGLSYNYSNLGFMKYNLASVVNGSTLPTGFSEFKVYVSSIWGSTFFWHYVEVFIGGSRILLYMDNTVVVGLKINGNETSIPVSGPSYNIYRSGSSVLIVTITGVFVQWNNWNLFVYVPKVEYAGLLRGLCGNNDGNPRNDWTLANGTSIANIANAETILGDSFIVGYA